jgi:photosystem II stability/assembly factor-like uncharacterized protein
MLFPNKTRRQSLMNFRESIHRIDRSLNYLSWVGIASLSYWWILLLLVAVVPGYGQWHIHSPNTYGIKASCLLPYDGTHALFGGRIRGILQCSGADFSYVQPVKDETKRYYISSMSERNGLTVAISDRQRFLLVSPDSGRTWQKRVAATLASDTAFSFSNGVWLGDNGKVWVAGSEEQDTIVDPSFTNYYWRGIILFSSDSGKTWVHQINRAVPGFRSIAFANDSEGYATKEFSSSIAKTTNGGKTWEDILTSVPDASSIRCLSADTVFMVTHASTKAGLYRSDDGGMSWSRALPFNVCGVFPSIDIRTSRNQTVIACTNRRCIYTSSNLGRDWVVDTLPKLRTLSYYSDLTNKGVADLKVVGNGSSDFSVIWLVDAEGDVYTLDVSTHLWKHLNPQSSNLDGACILGKSIVFASDSNCLESALPIRSPLGVMSVSDTLHWYTSPCSVDDSTAFIIGYDSANASHLFTTTDAGAHWKEREYKGQESLQSIFFMNSLIGFARNTTGPSYLSRTTDGGITWEPVVPGSVGVSALTMTRDSVLIAVGYDGGIVRSTDRGANWDFYQTADTNSLSGACTSPDGSVFVCGRNGSVQRSDDAGKSWRVLSAPGQSIHLTSIAFRDRLHGAALRGGQSSILFQTTDGGTTWSRPVLEEISDDYFPSSVAGLMVAQDGSIVAYGERGLIVSWRPAATPAEDLPPNYCGTLTGEFTFEPMPATTLLRVRHWAHSEVNEPKPFSVRFYDTAGREVFKQNVPGGADAWLDVSAISNGVYHVVVSDYQMRLHHSQVVVYR